MNEILKINDELLGLPAGVLVGIFAIAIGYLLKTLPFFNNKYIPITVVLFCTAAFMLVAPGRTSDIMLRIYLVRNFMIGVIIGFTVWTFHAQILRRFVDPHFFNDDGSTRFFKKPDTSNTNQEQTKQ